MQTETFISSKDTSPEATIATMQQKLSSRGFHLDESSWLNPVESIWFTFQAGFSLCFRSARITDDNNGE